MSLAIADGTAIEPDITMLPYYCDENGVYIPRQIIFSPSIKPHILIRAHIGDERGAVIAGPEDTSKVVNGQGKPLDATIDQEGLRKYLENIEVHFLNEIRITCASCGDVVGPPGVGRSDKRTYRNVMCAVCASTVLAL